MGQAEDRGMSHALQRNEVGRRSGLKRLIQGLAQSYQISRWTSTELANFDYALNSKNS